MDRGQEAGTVIFLAWFFGGLALLFLAFLFFAALVGAWPVFLVFGLWCLYREHNIRTKTRL
jgi:hypothetical protein